MQIRKLLALVLLGLSLSAAADFKTTTEVYEIDLPNLRLPASEGGTLALKECDDCEVLTLRVSAGTRYVVNHRDVTLVEFKKAISRVTNREDVIVDVAHHLASDSVTAVMVKL